MPKNKNQITLYDKIAHEYDELSREGNWYSPQILFGLHFDFIKVGEKLLDLGIGTGLSSKPYHKTGLEIYGVDSSRGMTEVCKGKKILKELYVFDLDNLSEKQLPFPSNYFDHAISNGALYFFDDLEPIFQEVKRLLKKDGTFGFTTEYTEERGISLRTITIEEAYGTTTLEDKLRISIYSHGNQYLEQLIANGFERLIRPLKYLAYHSPSEKRDVYYVAHIIRRKST